MISENAKKRWIMDLNKGVSLCFAPSNIRDEKDIVIYAVTINGMNLEFASLSLKSDIDVVKAAVSENLKALQFADEDLQHQIIFNGIESVLEFNKAKTK